LKWIGSARRDFNAMPEDVKDAFGYALDPALLPKEVKERHQDSGRRA